MIAVVMYFVAVVYPWLAAKKDYIQIELNGSYDSLKKAFHNVNVLIRALVFGSVGFLGSFAMYDLTLKAFVFVLFYGILSVFSFWFVFDTRLNKLRGRELGYIGLNAKTDNIMLSIYPNKTTNQAAKIQRLSLWVKILLFVLSNVLFWGYLVLNPLIFQFNAK